MANRRRKGGKIGRPTKIVVNTEGIDASSPIKYIRKCGSCNQCIVKSEGVLSWETMEFCKKLCLEKFQCEIGSKCTNCNTNVRAMRLGKLCVRIGYEINQFCKVACLNEYIAKARVCTRCQKDITRKQSAIFVDAGDGEFKDFCTEACKFKYVANANRERYANSSCSTCNRQKPITFELEHGDKVTLFCGTVCYTAYKYSHNISANPCKTCHKYYENKILEENSMCYYGETCSFCSPTCKNIYINMEKKIIKCHVCTLQKYSFDLINISETNPPVLVCSTKCLGAYESWNSSTSSNTSTPTFPTMLGNNKQASTSTGTTNVAPRLTADVIKCRTSMHKALSAISRKLPVPPRLQRNVATMCKVKVANLATTTENSTASVGVQKDIETNSTEMQTDPVAPTVLPIPLPTPVYVPLPMMMYSAPYPVLFPIPIPIPVPIFIATTKRTFRGVSKRIKKIVDRSLKDPLQDEMLMLAEMVSKDGNNVVSSSETESETETQKPAKAPARRRRGGGRRASFSNNVGSRMPRRARYSKEATPVSDYENDAVDYPAKVVRRTKRMSFNNDIENDTGSMLLDPVVAKPPRNNRKVMFADQDDEIIPTQRPNVKQSLSENELSGSDGVGDHDMNEFGDQEYPPPNSSNPGNSLGDQPFPKSRKRRQSSPGSRGGVVRKRGRPYPPKSVSPLQQPTFSSVLSVPIAPKPLPPLHELFKKPDNEMHLKYSIGISAWRQWAQSKHPGRFNPDILKLVSEDLDNSLCLFVNEVQKPSGQVYAPDTIYYLCLGIQQYLFLNGRTDNIFYNPAYKKFTDCLDEIAKKFLVLYNDMDFIVTRIEEEHLWESKQLGAHSPQVLLSTLLFFNTKFFNLTMVDEHKSLCFSHIFKNAKYNNMKSGRTRTVVLRYFPNGKEPQGQQAKPRRKKGFEQYENEENPLRCPIRLYEFYLSKCPESVKGSNGCFYLLPVSSCLPESSVWYSTMSMPDDEIEKVLNRFKIVREVTMALLAK